MEKKKEEEAGQKKEEAAAEDATKTEDQLGERGEADRPDAVRQAGGGSR